MKFKAGDKVRVLEEDSLYFGKIGLVSRVHINRECPYKVSVDGEHCGIIYKEEHLELIEESKPIKTNRLEELTTALNILGSLGIELDVKIHAEVNGKKIEL